MSRLMMQNRRIWATLLIGCGFVSFVVLVFNLVSSDGGEPASLPVVEAPVQEPVTVSEPEVSFEWQEGFFKGKPFFNCMLDAGLSANQVTNLIDALTPVYDFRRANPKHQWRLGFSDGKLARFELHVSPARIYDVVVADGKMETSQRSIEVLIQPTVVRAVLNNSLYGSLSSEPQSANLAMELARVFAYEIDFFQDPRQGDSFEILVEQEFIRNEDGLHFNRWGRILAARYQGQQSNYHAYFYDGLEDEGYFDAEGKSLVRDVLRSPLKLQRITSSFKQRRFHPVLKQYKAHNGVDYGVPKGTPVMAVANGKVIRAGRHGASGIMVELQHSKEMITHYLHLSKIASGVTRGGKVKQGQVIGYVGKTGYATGYHLHFGMKIRGKYVNPLMQKFQPGPPIPQGQLDSFLAMKSEYDQQLNGETSLDTVAPLVHNPGILKQYLPKQSKLDM